MSTLVIGDIHEKIDRVQKILDDHESKADRVVFVGDYFDKWEGHDKDTEQTARWLKDALNNPKYTFLWGNHDLQYGCQIGHKNFICSGYSQKTRDLTKEILTWDDWSKLKLDTEVEGFTVSHAGYTEWTKHLSKKGFLDAIQIGNYRNPLFAVGKDSGGHSEHPGPLWLRWDRMRGTKGLNQIVGHTERGQIEIKINHLMNVINLNIDCGLREILLVHGPSDWEVLR